MKEWFYRIGAHVIVIVHALWSILLWGGFLVMLLYHGYARYELLVLSATLVSQLIFFGCPLTKFEVYFRKQLHADDDYVEGSFMATYMNRLFGLKLTARHIRIMTAVLAIVTYTLGTLILTNKI